MTASSDQYNPLSLKYLEKITSPCEGIRSSAEKYCFEIDILRVGKVCACAII